jgi:hypothetical protein
MRGKKIPIRELVGASIEIKVTKAKIDKNNPPKS